MRTLTTTLAILLFFFAQSQVQKIELEKIINKSDLIIEAKLLNKECKRGLTNNNIYTINTFKVYKLLKGNTTESLVKVITRGGTIELEREVVTPNLNLQIGDTGILMLKNYNIKFKKYNNSISYKTVDLNQGFIKYYNESVYYKNKELNVNDFINDIVLKNPNTNIKTVNKREKQLLKSSGLKNNLSILNFTPTNISAGTNSILTIDGSNFGNTTGLIEFKDADTGATTFKSCLATDIISWTNTQIQVKVISGACTGSIKVVKSDTSEFESTSDLTVTYSHTNVIHDGENYKSQHINKNGNGGYIWQMSSNFEANSDAKNTILRAFNKHICESKIYWEIGDTTTTNVSVKDGENVIIFDNNDLSETTLGICRVFHTGCSNNGTIEWYLDEMDLIFNTSMNWNFTENTPAINEIDFESVALHELGHAHLLGHVNDINDVMHFSLGFGQQNRDFSENNKTAMSDMQGTNTANNTCSQNLMQNLACPGLNTPRFTFNDNTIIYNNPVNNILRLQNLPENCEILVFNTDGKLVKSKKNTSKEISIETNRLKNGLYFLNIVNGNNSSTYKIIKN